MFTVSVTKALAKICAKHISGVPKIIASLLQPRLGNIITKLLLYSNSLIQISVIYKVPDWFINTDSQKIKVEFELLLIIHQ